MINNWHASHFNSFPPTHVINSIKQEHSCKILNFCYKRSTHIRSLYLQQDERSCRIPDIGNKRNTHVRSSISATRGAFMIYPICYLLTGLMGLIKRKPVLQVCCQVQLLLSHTPDWNFRCFYPCEIILQIILSHISIPACGKKRTAAHWCTPFYDGIVMLKLHYHVASHPIQDLWMSFSCLSNIK